MKTLEELIKDNDWINISAYQNLSEKFIEKYSNKVYWEYISIYKKLSEEFIEKHSDKFSLNYLSHDTELNEDKRYNICIKCNCSDYNLHNLNCDEAIMDRVLK